MPFKEFESIYSLNMINSQHKSMQIFIIIMTGDIFKPLGVVEICLNSQYFLLFPTEETTFPRD